MKATTDLMAHVSLRWWKGGGERMAKRRATIKLLEARLRENGVIRSPLAVFVGN